MAPSLMAKRRARLLVYAMISAFGLLGYGARERMSRASSVSRVVSIHRLGARFDPTTRAPPSLTRPLPSLAYPSLFAPGSVPPRPARRGRVRRGRLRGQRPRGFHLARGVHARDPERARRPRARPRRPASRGTPPRVSPRATRRARPSPNVHRGRFLGRFRLQPRPSSSRKRRRSPRRRCRSVRGSFRGVRGTARGRVPRHPQRGVLGTERPGPSPGRR